MNTGSRIAVLAAVVVIAVVGFIVLKPDETSDKQSAEQTTATTTPANTTAAPRAPGVAAVVQIRVKNGKPVGGVEHIAVQKNDRVRFTVSSDVSDHVHVHGYDFMKDVKAGGKVGFSFKAKLDGVYEIELEEHAEQIAELEVQP
jgi:heme/copper-type cytochrome/quinol oxidase subunit 2